MQPLRVMPSRFYTIYANVLTRTRAVSCIVSVHTMIVYLAVVVLASWDSNINNGREPPYPHFRSLSTIAVTTPGAMVTFWLLYTLAHWRDNVLPTCLKFAVTHYSLV